jgi:hypothetical protein
VNYVQRLAGEMGVTERSVRRLMALGVIRKARLTPRCTRVHEREREYLRRRWPQLAEVRRELRTCHIVRLAVLFGPAARDPDAWEERPLDVYVERLGDSWAGEQEIRRRLALCTGQEVRVHEGSRRPLQTAPLWLLDVFKDGRVLIDRDGLWAQCRKMRGSLSGRAQRSSRNAARRTFPLEVFGSSAAKSTIRGYL